MSQDPRRLCLPCYNEDMNEFEVPDTKEIAETFTFSTKETNDKMPLFIGGAVIIIAIAAFIFGIGAFLKKVNIMV